ncbi:MAG: T9SS type A sorting domain-containing protein [bacterium]
MKTIYRISSIIALYLFLIASQLTANEDVEKIVKDMPRLLGSTNEGTEFLMTFHPGLHNTNLSKAIKIYISSAYTTKVTIEIPGKKVSLQKTTIPNGVIEVAFSPDVAQCYTKSVDEPPQSQQVYKGYAIIIKSNAPIICYGISNSDNLSEGYMAIPTKSLGKNYIVSSYNDPSWDNGVQYLTSYTSIVGVYDNTTVNIKLGGRFANYTPGTKKLKTGDSDSKVLNKGDVWLIGVQGDYNDLTGTSVNADKQVAVVSGSYCANVPAQMGPCNYLIEQDLPMESWGTKYHVAPIYHRQNASIIRFFAAQQNTKIYKNGIEWSNIIDVGGAETTGYKERRFVSESESYLPVTISAYSPINVVQYNTGQEDDGEDASSFQMALTPVEQYQKSLFWCTPGTKEGAPFHKNYLNIIYKSTSGGQIPDDLQFGEVMKGVMTWAPLSTLVNKPGFEIPDPDVTDFRYYYSLTITLGDSLGVYGLKANDPLTAYIYGYGDSLNSYAYPVSVSVKDLTKDDTKAPLPTYVLDCCGQVHGSVTEQPEDELLRSNLANIYMNKIESYNYFDLEYDEANFNPGVTETVDWKLVPCDWVSDARAVLTFSDRAGNDTTITIDYQPARFSLQNSVVDWGNKGYDALPESKAFNIKNKSSKAIVIDSIMLLSADKGREWAYNGFKLDPAIYKANGGVLPGYSIPVGGELIFNLIFDPATVKAEFDAGKLDFLDSIGIKANWSDVMNGGYCYSRYIGAAKAAMAYPCISVDRVDFGKVNVGETRTMNFTIFNHGSSQLTITGYSFFSGNADGIYETSLGAISAENPVRIWANEAKTFTVTFKPKEMINYSDKIIFESDAFETCTDHDPILELNGAGTDLLIEPIADVTILKNTIANIAIITNSAKPSTLKVTLRNDSTNLFHRDSTLITGSNNIYNLKINPIKDSTGSCYVEIDAEDEFRSGSTSFKFTVEGGGSVEDNLLINNSIFISPNPVNSSSVNIEYELNCNCTIVLALYNSNGLLISNLLNEFQAAGSQSFTLPVGDLAAGVYFIELKAGDSVGHKSFVIVK